METPFKLVDYMFKVTKHFIKDVDAVLINGDFIGHGIAIKNPWDGDHQQVWSIQKSIINT